MRVNISRWTRYTMLGIVVSSLATTGCSSGWKVPTMKMPWSKKPSEAALAGTGPSALTYPTSPAAKQSPNAIASTAAGHGMPGVNGAPATSALAQANAAKASPALYAAPSMASASGTGYKSPTTGTAAASNGYQTGPYSTYGQATPGAAVASSGPANRPATPATPSGQIPSNAAGYAASNPYAPPPATAAGMPNNQTYGAGLASTPYSGRPATAQATAAPTSNAMGQFATAGYPAPGGFNMPSAPNGLANANVPPAPGMNPMTVPSIGGAYNAIGATPTANTAPNAFAQSMPNTNGMNPGFSMPNGQATAPGGMGQLPAQTATYSVPSTNNFSTASYRPGSTSRNTGYNFGSPEAPTGGQTAFGGYPPPVSGPANMASGLSNPGYSLPPSSTLNR